MNGGGGEDRDQSLRRHLLELLKGGSAHQPPAAILAHFPAHLRGVLPAGMKDRAEHTAWQLLEHLRITQWDILEFSRNPHHVSPPWPEGYWPESAAPPDEAAWDRGVKTFLDDLQAMMDLVTDLGQDLYAPFPWGDGQTLLREALLTADHNSHHLGQVILLRRLLGAWPPG